MRLVERKKVFKMSPELELLLKDIIQETFRVTIDIFAQGK